METTRLQLQPAIRLSDDQFLALCQQNPDLKLERNPQGSLLIMPPTGGETGRRNALLIARLVLWIDIFLSPKGRGFPDLTI